MAPMVVAPDSSAEHAGKHDVALMEIAKANSFIDGLFLVRVLIFGSPELFLLALIGIMAKS
jgi:hypothetical protein